MIVFKYFFEKNDLFGPLIDTYEQADSMYKVQVEQSQDYIPPIGDIEEQDKLEDSLTDTVRKLQNLDISMAYIWHLFAH